MNESRINEEIKRVSEELNPSDKILKDFPIKKFINILDNYPRYTTHKYVSPDLLRFSGKLEERYGTKNLEIYNQRILLELIKRPDTKNTFSNLSPVFKEMLERKKETILHSISKPLIKLGQFQLSHERFIYNLNICKGTSLAYGPFRLNLYKPGAGYFKFIFKTYKNIRLFSIGFKVYRAMFRYSPMLDLHIDPFDRDLIRYFNEKKWKTLFEALAELLLLNPDIKAIIGNSWFFDKKLKEISPEIAYIREIIETLESKIYYIGPTSNGIINATRGNVKRKTLYEEGKYTPENYLFILDQNCLIKNVAKLKKD